MDEELLLTVSDLATKWRLNEASIRRYVADGVITPCKGVPGVRFHIKGEINNEHTQI